MPFALHVAANEYRIASRCPPASLPELTGSVRDAFDAPIEVVTLKKEKLFIELQGNLEIINGIPESGLVQNLQKVNLIMNLNTILKFGTTPTRYNLCIDWRLMLRYIAEKFIMEVGYNSCSLMILVILAIW